MRGEFSKRDRRKVRELAWLAWERELRGELRKIADAIEQMNAGELTPFQVNDRIHEFHNGMSRDLYNDYSGTVPWWAVCAAHREGVLTDEDLADASETIRDQLRTYQRNFAAMHASESDGE